MKSYAALIRSNLRLMLRDRAVLFFSLLFPLSFFSCSPKRSMHRRAPEPCRK